MVNLLQVLGWLICGLYSTIPAFWMLVHPFVHRWRAARVRFKWMGAWWVLLWIIAWAIGWRWHDRVLLFGPDVAYHHRVLFPAIALLAPLFWAGSIYLYSKGGTGLSLRRVIGAHEVEPQSTPDQLVTTGIYAHTRNPIYLGHTCTLLGWCCATSTVSCWAYLIFYLVTLFVMLPMEERELSQRFGKEYEDYCRRVPRLIPKL